MWPSFSWIVGWFDSLLDLIICAVKRGMCQFGRLLWEWLEEHILQVIWDDYLDGHEPDWDLTFLGEVWATLDVYLPMTLLGTLFGLWLALWLVLTTWRAIKAHIPTMS